MACPGLGYLVEGAFNLAGGLIVEAHTTSNAVPVAGKVPGLTYKFVCLWSKTFHFVKTVYIDALSGLLELIHRAELLI